WRRATSADWSAGLSCPGRRLSSLGAAARRQQLQSLSVLHPALVLCLPAAESGVGLAGHLAGGLAAAPLVIAEPHEDRSQNEDAGQRSDDHAAEQDDREATEHRSAEDQQGQYRQQGGRRSEDRA